MKPITRSLGLVAACGVLWFSGPASAQISANGQVDPAGVRPIARGNFTTFTATASSCPTMGRGVQQIGAGFVAAFSQGMGSATIDVEGTADTLSVVASMDGAHWVAVSKVYAMPYTGTNTSSITTTGQYAINAAGWMYVCVFDPSFANGPTVTLNTSPATFADISGGGSGGGGGGGAGNSWTLMAAVTATGTTVSTANLATGTYHEIIIFQDGGGGGSGAGTLYSISPAGTAKTILSCNSISGGNNGAIFMLIGPTARASNQVYNINDATTPYSNVLSASAEPVPPTIQFATPTQGTYTIYGR